MRATSVAYSSAPGFNAAALEAASRWRFDPARWNGEPTDARAYLVFGFRAPVITSP
jgi:outer membrane biosynthesis protein TonB